jgi:hypothetical protein
VRALIQHKYTHKYTHTHTHTHESSHTLILKGKKKKLNNLVREMGARGMVMTDEQVSQWRSTVGANTNRGICKAPAPRQAPASYVTEHCKVKCVCVCVCVCSRRAHAFVFSVVHACKFYLLY